MYEADSRTGRPKQEVPAPGAAPAATASSEDDKKTKKQLVDELAGLRQRIKDLEAFESERKAIAKELKGTRQRLQYLLAVSPAIIYTTKASGDYACTFVSENLRAIMGYGPQEMTTDPKGWPDHLHPDDAPRAFGEMLPLIGRGGGTVEYRFRHRDGHYIWIQDTFKVVYDDAGHPLELVGAWADITERKEAERHALEANAEIQETKRYLTQADRELARRHHRHRQAGQCRAVQRGRRDLAGLSRQRGRWPPHHAALRQRGSLERACTRDAQARRHGLRF